MKKIVIVAAAVISIFDFKSHGAKHSPPSFWSWWPFGGQLGLISKMSILEVVLKKNNSHVDSAFHEKDSGGLRCYLKFWFAQI